MTTTTLSLFDIIESPPVPRARRTDPETSRLAAIDASFRATSNRMLALETLEDDAVSTTAGGAIGDEGDEGDDD